MRSKWNASFPRTPADAGKSHVVIAFNHGDTPKSRMEFEGQLRREDAQMLMNTAIEMMKRAKP